MLGEIKPYVEEAAEELELDKVLGLKNQAFMDLATVVRKDIDELTKSNDYYEVDEDDLEKLFEIPTLRRKCWNFNIWNAFKAVAPIIEGGIFAAITYFIFYYLIEGSPSDQTMQFSEFVLGIVGIITAIITIGWPIGRYTETKNDDTGKMEGGVSAQFAGVKLIVEDLTKTNIKIPRGAKLKTLEAQDTKIFDKFQICYPHFHIKEKVFKINLPKLDPAIVGVTADKRMYMVCYWDIQNDIEKVNRSINRLKKFKLQ